MSLALGLTLSAIAGAQTPVVTTSHTASDPALQRLEREIARLATVSGGVVGVTAEQDLHAWGPLRRLQVHVNKNGCQDETLGYLRSSAVGTLCVLASFPGNC